MRASILNENPMRFIVQKTIFGLGMIGFAVPQKGEKMNDLISRQAAIDALHMHLMYRMGTDSNKKRLDEWINNLPSAQPERKPGRWIKTNNTNYSPFDNSPEYNMICSECFYTSEKAFNFCPNCGAKMEVEHDRA